MKRDKLNKREPELLEELETLLANPRAEEIVANDWLHDSTLPVPSIDLMRYFAFRMLTGYGIKIEATMADRNGLIESLVQHLRNETPEQRAASIPRTIRHLDCFKYLHTGKTGTCASDPHLHEWLPLLWPYLYPEAPEGDADALRVAAGERMIARGLIEAMMHRALFTRDYKRLESLSAAMRMIRLGEDPKPTFENRVMGEILRCMPHLNERLKRLPSRAEIKEFIQQRAGFMGESFSRDPTPWPKAWRKLMYPADARAHRMNRDLIVRLARESCG